MSISSSPPFSPAATRHFFNFISWHFHGYFVSRDLRLFISSALLIVNFYGLAIAATKEQQDTNPQNGKNQEKIQWK